MLFEYGSYSYHKIDEHGKRVRYRCLHASKQGVKCKATLSIEKETSVVFTSTTEHTCRRKPVETINLTEFCKTIAEEMTLSNIAKPTKCIYQQIVDELERKTAKQEMAYIKPGKRYIYSVINNLKAQHFQNSANPAAMSPDLCTVGPEDNRMFLRFDFNFANRIKPSSEGCAMKSILLWSHPDLSILLRREATCVHVDATFRCTPAPFSQCLILLVHDQETDMNVPAVYAFTDGHDTWTWWHFPHLCSVVADCKLKPRCIVTDFEMSLVKSVADYFPNAVHVGCDFHIKQALRRKLQKLRVGPTNLSVSCDSR